MIYGKIEGPIFFRLAKTAAVINSSLAETYGIEAPMACSPVYGYKIRPGENVKVRLFLDNRTRRMTCHARIDWIDKEEGTDRHKIGFSNLSLSDHEYKVLMNNFTEPVEPIAQLGDTVRRVDAPTTPVTVGEDNSPIIRDKAVTLPVSLIERIDEERGAVPFSEFVVSVLRRHVKD